jgi:Cdc6-like AAA superfamily ATPase
LIGISNAIDTLEQYFGRLGYNYRVIQNIVFRPYDVDKIIEIITDKLTEIKQKTDIQINFP